MQVIENPPDYHTGEYVLPGSLGEDWGLECMCIVGEFWVPKIQDLRVMDGPLDEAMLRVRASSSRANTNFKRFYDSGSCDQAWFTLF